MAVLRHSQTGLAHARFIPDPIRRWSLDPAPQVLFAKPQFQPCSDLEQALYSFVNACLAGAFGRHRILRTKPLSRRLRSFLSHCLIVTLVTATSLPSRAYAELSRADYEECQARDEDGLRTAIAAVAADALKTGIGKIDYPALVADQWRNKGLDEIIDKRVDIAIEDVKHETSWSERIKSLANSETSQKLATNVAERVYRSDATKAALEDLATGVANEVGKSIEFASAESAGPLMDCLRAFVGPKYGSSVAQSVAGDTGKDLTVDPAKGAGEVSTTSVLKQTSGGIAGATVLVVRRQLANLATRVGQRLAGSVLSRLVSVAAGGVGLVLIAKDLWELRHGVLPIIASEMKAPATKEKVQAEIATGISEQISAHVKDIATATADHVIEVWQGFKRAHALVLRLSDANAGFKSFLDGVKTDQLPRLDEVVSLVVSAEGEGGVLKRLDDGSLNTAVHLMPEKALDIARDTKSVAAALAWSALAGDKLDRVVNYELYRRTEPSTLTRASLDRVLALDDRAAITRVAAVPQQARDALFNLDDTNLKSLAKSLSENELTTLAGYLTGLQAVPRDAVLRAVAANPAKMQILASGRVRDAIIASADQSAAVTMMLAAGEAFNPRQFIDDAGLVWTGRVSPWLLWDRHPAGLAIAAVLSLIVLMWTRRLFRRRPAPPSAGASENTV